MHGDVQLVPLELEHAGEEIPSETDRFALVVVAEAEIAEHLEEGSVASGPADVLDVALRPGDAQAALHGHRTRGGRGDLA